VDATNHIKIAKFGCARWITSSVADTRGIVPYYAAPGLFRDVEYDCRMADIWSVGVILFAMLAGKLPFDDPSLRVMCSLVKAGKFVMPPFDNHIAELISGMLQVDVDKRWTIDQIKKLYQTVILFQWR
jgi:BR serine/threonine kinase